MRIRFPVLYSLLLGLASLVVTGSVVGLVLLGGHMLFQPVRPPGGDPVFFSLATGFVLGVGLVEIVVYITLAVRWRRGHSMRIRTSDLRSLLLGLAILVVTGLVVGLVLLGGHMLFQPVRPPGGDPGLFFTAFGFGFFFSFSAGVGVFVLVGIPECVTLAVRWWRGHSMRIRTSDQGMYAPARHGEISHSMRIRTSDLRSLLLALVAFPVVTGLVMEGLIRLQDGRKQPPTAPVMRLETGMHTAPINRIGVDATQRYLVTGSDDKTVRVWELATGRLLRTLRPSIGAGNEGKIYAVALSPDGSTVAAAGWTGYEWDGSNSIYLFDRASGRLRQRLTGLPQVILHLAYSRDGAFLAATLHETHGMRVFRSSNGAEVTRDTAYGGGSYWADFDPSGRLVTTSQDGFVRLYDRDFRLLVKHQASEGKKPYGIAFSPDGSRVAVGFEDSTRVDVLSGQDLTPLYAPDTTGVDEGGFKSIAWSADGQWLYAGGSYYAGRRHRIRRWATGGQGPATDLPAAQHTVKHLLPLTGGGVVFGSYGPEWGVLDATGQRQLFQGPAIVQSWFLTGRNSLRIAPDGATVQFGYELLGKVLGHFAVRDRTLTLDPAPDPVLATPVTTAPSLEVRLWQDSIPVTLNGTALKLEPSEFPQSFALAPDSQRFLLGTSESLRLFDHDGQEQWRVAVPDKTQDVNIAGNGQVAVAALADGTIRWYRLRDGQELLAFFPHNDRKRWVLWTPSGYYTAASGAEDLIGWHVNRGRDWGADFFPVGQSHATFYRPDVVTRILDTLDEAEALRQADAEVNRRQEAAALQQRLPPVVTILAPPDGATVSSTRITVHFSLHAPSDAPVTAIKGLVDGRLVTQTRVPAQLKNDKDEVTHALQLTVPPRDYEVTIIAENRHAASAPATIRLRWQGIRRALVIGNAAYKEAPLRNPVNDATDMAKTLRELGFTVTLRQDVTREEMEKEIAVFTRPGQEGGVGLFYFSGHGMQVQGQNYLLPLKAQLDSEADVRFRAVPADWVLAKMEEAGYRLNIVILDACRNTPYAQRWRSATRGLARMEGLTGSLVAYATAPGMVADDGPGRNGVYTRHLLQQMRVSGLTLEELFRRVRVAVMQETGRKQVPWESSSLTEAFSFVPSAPLPSPATPPPAPGTPGGIQVAVGTYPPPPSPASAQTIVNSIGMQFVLVPAGTFKMGSNDGDDDEKPVHEVRITKPFDLGKYEVTQGQWQVVMGSNPSYFKGDPNRPVENVSWDDVQAFIRKLNAKEGGTAYRLPTEAEWEYAARTGTTTAYSFGNNAGQLGEYAWYSANAGSTTHPVGQKKPNVWGLYDMHGNVWEWVQDWYGSYTTGSAVDPEGPASGSYRVFRGGSWRHGAGLCRSAFRFNGASPGYRLDILGFRLLRTAL